MTDVAAASAAAPPAPSHVTPWHSASGFGFRDILDIINPLQHLPVIGSIYRWLTGDRPGVVAQIAGDALYGGPIGFGVSVLSAATEDSQGRDLGEQAITAIFGNHASSSTSAVAAQTPAAPAASPVATSSAAVPAASTAAAAPPLPTVAPMPMALPARQPIPLYGGLTAAMPPTAAQAFEAHQAALERSITAGRTGPTPTPPVPLVLPAGTLLNRPPMVPAPAPGAPPPNPAQPIDVPQKMLDALDKYMQLERDRKGSTAPPPAGSSLDLAL
jgi:hypothetical protein